MSLLRHNANTWYGWLTTPYPAGTSTLQEAPSFAWRTRRQFGPSHLRILCDAFQIEFSGQDHRCEKLLVQEAYKIHRAGKMLVPVIDDAHLMPGECLRVTGRSAGHS